MNLLNQALQYLACPNCGGSLTILEKKLLCQICNSDFKIISKNFVELLPKSMVENLLNNKKYEKYYSDLTQVGHSTDPHIRKWGLASKSISEGFAQEVRKNLGKIFQNQIVFDVGAGMGDYSLYLAKNAKFVFHCDLDLEATSFAQKQAQEHKLENMFFIRCDYFSLPFKKNSIPSFLCIDVVERGLVHDTKVLQEFSSKVEKNGLVVIDVHSKERIKINRAKDEENRYSKNDIKKFLFSFNLNPINIFGMGYILQLTNFKGMCYVIGNHISKLFFPPARWLIISKKY